MPFLVFILTALACGVLALPVRRILLRRGVIDRPNERSSHTQPTVRGGGIAIMAIVAIGAGIIAIVQQEPALAAMAAAAIVLAWVSFVDDLRSMSRLLRFGCHAACAVITIAVLGFPSVTLSFTETSGFILPFAIGLPFLFLWIAGYTNAFNFMDGINGIAASQAIVTAGGTAAIAFLAGADLTDAPVLFGGIIAGAAAGFLPYNFPRARMFMGDVSSAPLGYLLASLAVWVSAKYGWWLLIPLVALHANFVFDTAITLIRRIVRGERWYDPHREHFYQRLIRSGRSHAFVTGWELALQLMIFGLMSGYLYANASLKAFLLMAVVGIWGSFFAYAERSFQRTMLRKASFQQIANQPAQ